jgi:peptidoglycan/LPS O-acetylase OafA/YrhL
VPVSNLRAIDDNVDESVTGFATRSFFRPDIQGLRAVAVILVIVAHSNVAGFRGGYIGVDVFFVISGYVITGLLLRQRSRSVRSNLARFYARRIRRIVPAATVVLAVTTIASDFLLGQNFDPRLLGDVRWASLFAANFHLINTGSNYFISGLAPSLVMHYWSLAVEEQFYLFYPLVIFSLALVVPRRNRTRQLGVLLVAGVVASAWWSFHLTPLHSTAAYYSPFTRFWELGLGGLVAILPAAWAKRRPLMNGLLSIVAVVVLGLAATKLSTTSVYPGVLAWWPCSATAVLLWTGQSSVYGAPASWLSWRPLRYVGDISYSLYLWHFVWLMLPLQMVHPPTSVWTRPIEILGTLVCAMASYHLLENPIRHSERLDRDRFAVVLLLMICVATSWDVTIYIGHLAHVH